MNKVDVNICRLIQGDLPVAERPFKEIARKTGISETGVIKRIKKLIRAGIIRKFRAVLRHRAAGFRYNAMVVWNVPEKRIERAGSACMKFKQISHCYQRIACPGWQYNFYTMIHGQSEKELEGTVKAVFSEIKVRDYKMLYSKKELKKVSGTYF